MNKFVIFIAILGCAAAAPGLYFQDSHDTHVSHVVPVLHTHTISSPSKTTITKNSQVVNHGGHEIVHVPVHQSVHLVHEPVHVVHEPVHLVHEPVYSVHKEPAYAVHKEPAKSSQYFKLENTEYKTHKVVTPVVQKVVPVVHAPVYHTLVHTPVVTRTGDSAVSHQSSTTHETVQEVKHLPLYTLHH